MKKLIFLFLSLTCLAANAQYHKSRATAEGSHLASLRYYVQSKFDLDPTQKPDLKLPYFLTPGATTSSQPSYTLYNNSAFSSPSATSNQGYWSGTRMTTSSLNGHFQAIQSFDLQGNLRESKATYQFKSRKKR